MGLHKSGEDYLETIFLLKKDNETVRSIDIAHALSYSKPSISRAMSILKKDGYITIDSFGHIDFTESGLEVAQRMYRRHTMLEKWLTMIGVSAETAADDACRIEHVISKETFERIADHIKPESKFNRQG